MIRRAITPPPVTRAARLRPGTGTRVSYSPSLGAIVSADTAAPPPALAWRPALAGGAVRFFADGRVMGIQPRIGDAKLMEGAVRLDGVAPVDGESWVCVEVTPTIIDGVAVIAGAKGEAANKNIVIVHRDSPFHPSAETGRQPLALIVWAGSRPQFLIQHTFFNLQYRRVNTGTRIDHEFT